MKRFLAMLLALTLVLSMIPATALQVRAEEVNGQEETLPTEMPSEQTEPAETAAQTIPAETVPETVPESVPETEPTGTGPLETEPAEEVPAEKVPESIPTTEPVPEETLHATEPPVDDEGEATNTSWDTMEPVVLGQTVFVHARGEGDYRYYAFTPEEDGYYMIQTTAVNGCVSVYEQQNGEWCNTESTSEDGHYSGINDATLCLASLSAGKTYALEVYGGGFELSVEKTNITNVEVTCPESDIYEYTRGSWAEDWNGDYYDYYLFDLLQITVTFDDGTQLHETKSLSVDYNGHTVYFPSSCSANQDQSAETPWTAGNSYEVYFDCFGKHTCKVNILEAPEDITLALEPVVINKENYGYNSQYTDNGEWVEYKAYYVENRIQGTITIDGVTYEIQENGSFYYPDAGYSCSLWVKDDQGPGNEWDVGVHEVTVGVLGVEVTLPVTIADKWGMAQQLELDEPVLVEEPEFDGYQYYTFTPDEDGYYVIYTSGEGYKNFTVYEPGEDGAWDRSGESNSSYDHGRLHLMPMRAGKTYGIEICLFSDSKNIHLAVEKSNITKVEVCPEVELYEYTNGSWINEYTPSGWTGDYYHYEIDDLVTYTIFYDDGTQKTGTASSINYYDFTYIWHGYEVSFRCDVGGRGQFLEDPWIAGKTYDAYCIFLGSEFPIQAKILEAPEDITIELEPIVIDKDHHGTAYGYNSKGEYVEYNWYHVQSALNGTITIDGKSFDIIRGRFFDEEDVEDIEDGTEYELWVRHNQGPDNEWRAGAYNVTVGIMGVELPVTVTIYDEWAFATQMELETMFYVGGFEYSQSKTFTFTPEEDGYYMFLISNWNSYSPTSEFYQRQKKGDWQWCGFNNGNSYGQNDYNARLTYMSAGETYGMKCSYDSSDPDLHFCVTVNKVGITDVEVTSDINFYEYTHGRWEGYEGYWEENGGYYHYSDLLDRVFVTVTYADGTKEISNIEDCTIKLRIGELRFHWDAWSGDNQSSQHRWTAGNSYKMYVNFLGKTYNQKVNILEAPENITFELDTVSASSEDFRYLYEDFGDGEEIHWKEYQWEKYINGTITIDGAEYTVRNGRFYYPDAGYYCSLYTRDDQKWNNVWETDKIYEATVGVLGAEADCFVMVEDIPAFNDYIYDYLEQAPDLREMTEMEPDSKYPAAIDSDGGISWFAFTPEEDGTYCFFSSQNDIHYYSESHGVLFDSNLDYLCEANSDIYSAQFAIMRELSAGETYVLAVKAYGEDEFVNIGVKKTLAISKLQLDPIVIPADANCWREGEITFYYDWRNCIKGKAIFEDGSSAVLAGTTFEHDGMTHPVYGDDTQFDEAWVEGKTYPVSVSCCGMSAETTVEIAPNSIKSITFKPITIPAKEYEGEYYFWDGSLSWTVTFKNGKKLSGIGSSFNYNNYHYEIYTVDDQYENPFVAGNTYTGYATVGSHEVPVSITIKNVDHDLPYVENLNVKKATPDSVQITFDKLQGAAKYDFYLNDIYQGSSASNSFTFKNLTEGVYYELGVAAVHKVDGKEVSGPVNSIWGKPYIDISRYSVVMEYTSVAYDGTEKKPEIIVKQSSGKVLSPAYYDCEFINNMEAGQATAYIYGLEQYGGTIIANFKIVPQQVTGLEVTELTENSATITFEPASGASEYWIYNGTKLVDKIQDTTYTFTGLKLGVTYNFSVQANAFAEEFVPGKYPETRLANYTGEISESVSTKPTCSLDGFTVELKNETVAYTGKAQKPGVKVISDEGKKLGGSDYTVTYADNVEIGTATVIITGKGKYEGTITATFDIVPPRANKAKVEALSGSSVELTYKGLKKGKWEPEWYEICVDGVLHGRTSELTYVVDGLPAGKNIKFTVRAGVTIDGKDYIGEESPPAPIVLKHKMDVCTLTLEQTELVYTGKALTPAVTVTGYGGVVLEEKVDYTVKYQNNKNTGIATVTVTGKGAYTGKASATFVINPAQTTGLKVKSTTTTSVTITFTRSPSAQYYNVYLDGVYHGRTTGSTYTFKNLVLSEIHDVYVIPEKTVKKVTYVGDASDTIQVWAGTDISRYNVTMEYVRADYAGEPLCPSVIVKSSSKKTATVLVAGEDYIVEYVNNNNPGKASIVISGIGKYAGTITKTFTIFMVKPAVTAVATGTDTILVEFEPVPGATEYQVCVGGRVKATITDTSFEITGLKKRTTYKIAVKALYVAETYKQTSVSPTVKVKTLSE